MKTEIRGQSFDRSFRVEVTRGEADGPTRYRASLSSEEPVERFFGKEVLVHDADAINLERAGGNGLMMLWNHDIDRPLGRIQNVELTKRRRLEGELEFSDSLPDADWIERGVAEGVLDDISLRYQIDDYRIEEDSDGNQTIFVTRFTPTEGSVVTVPADYAGSGIGRSKSTEGTTMTGKNTPAPAGQTGSGEVDVVDFQAARAQAIGEGEALGAARERERLQGIDGLFVACRYQGPAYDALKAECISRGSSVEQTRAAIFDMMNQEPGEQTGSRTAPDAPTHAPEPARGSVIAGETSGEKFLQGAERAIEYRVKLIKGPDVNAEMRTNEFTGWSMAEIAREYLRVQGVNVRGLSRHDVIGYALRPDMAQDARRNLVGHGPGDFANLLATTAQKSMLVGWLETEETWQIWTREGTLQDFRQADRVGMSNFGDLDEIPVGGEYKAGTMSDLVEYIKAKKYGKLFGIYREALLADDLDGLSRTPRAMGRAASRKVGDKVYEILTSPPTLNQDSLDLFNAGHNNTGTAGAPSVTTWDEMRQLFALQTDPSSSSHGLNIKPKFAIVPTALETTSTILATAEKDPAGGAGKSEVPNPFSGQIQVVADPRLDADSSVKWYAAGDPNMHDTVEVAFVDGRSEPMLESRDGWSVDGIEYKTRIEVGVSALDFRALGYNAGA